MIIVFLFIWSWNKLLNILESASSKFHKKTELFLVLFYYYYFMTAAYAPEIPDYPFEDKFWSKK